MTFFRKSTLHLCFRQIYLLLLLKNKPHISKWPLVDILQSKLPHTTKKKLNKTASFQKEAMRTQVALYFFYEVKFV